MPHLRPLISAERIAARVAALGAEIDRALPPGDIVVVGVLWGAFVFMADLIRVIPRNLRCDFLGVRSYGDATVSSGEVAITSDLSLPIEGQHVLLIEDIVDTGLTLRFLLDLLHARRPASVHVCALLARKSRPNEAAAPVHFTGFDAPDTFVVGYGLDAAQRYRHLPYIAALEGVVAA